MKSLFLRFLEDESGVTAIEYALLAAAIAVGMLTAAQKLGSKMSNAFNNIGNNLS
jgi:pilus assembly protein Flp/PilA